MAASEEQAVAGEDAYQSSHMQLIFEEGLSFSGYERDLLAINDRRGAFVDLSGVSGIDSVSDGRGAVFADFDDDGDLDVFLTTLQHDAHLLFRNDLAAGSRSLTVALEGRSPGLDAFGATVTVVTGERSITRVKSGGSGFLAQHDPRLVFGLAPAETIERIDVAWPGGERQTIERPPAGRALFIRQGDDTPRVVERESFSLPDPATPTERLASRLGWGVGASLTGVGAVAPDGSTTRLGALARPGRKLLVNLWATWCTSCREEIAELNRLTPPLAANGIDVVGLSVDVETADHVFEFAERIGVEYPVLLADRPAIERLYPDGEIFVPVSILLDESGQVVELIGGWSSHSRARIEELASR